MDKILEQIFANALNGKEFKEADNILDKECEERLHPYIELLKDAEYEQIRDVIFSISCLSKKYAFEIGFKTAIKLILECMSDK